MTNTQPTDLVDQKFSAALASFQNGETEHAEDLCASILEENPNHANTLNLMGIISLKQGSLEKAQELIQKAIQNLPEKAPVFSCNLALVYTFMGNIHVAASVYRNAARMFLAKEEVDEAIACLEKAAILFRMHGQFEDAKQFYLNMLTIDPSRAATHNDLGVILRQTNDLEGALTCLQRAIEIDPAYTPAYNNLGAFLLEQKNLPEAAKFLEKAVEMDPSSVSAHLNLGIIYLEEDLLDKAAYHCLKAIELAPDHPGAYNNLGIVFQEQGKIHEAIAQYQKALAIDPSYEAAQQHLTNLQASLN